MEKMLVRVMEQRRIWFKGNLKISGKQKNKKKKGKLLI
jgi:hypothetical protein